MTEPQEASAGETGGREAMSDERLAEIRAHRDEYGFVGATDVDSVVAELLTEIERLNDVLHANTVIRNAAESTGRVYKSLASRLREERDQARADVARGNEEIALLNAELTTERDAAEEAIVDRAELAAATLRAETAERELAEMRERIGWGEQLSDEWGWTWRGHDRIEGGCNSEETARSLANHGDTIMRRIVSKWKAADGG